jgi:hypothetical protein
MLLLQKTIVPLKKRRTYRFFRCCLLRRSRNRRRHLLLIELQLAVQALCIMVFAEFSDRGQDVFAQLVSA